MEKTSIASIISLIPSDTINQPRFVQHFFYGADNKLKTMRRKIKNLDENAIFDFQDGALIVTTVVIIDEKNLSELQDKLQFISDHIGVEYDGFEILTNDHTSIQQAFEPFENHFHPWSYLRMPLNNGKFGYILYIGGDSKNGCFYECIALSDDGMSDVSLLDNAPRLYRQIVQGYFDPLIFEFIGISSNKMSMSKAYFRVIEDALSPDELALIYEKYGFRGPFQDCDWLPLLNEIAKSKGTELCTCSKYVYRISISDDGNAKWSDLEEWNANESASPMPFGVIARYESLNDALTGGFDLLALTDYTHRVNSIG